ncbi:ZNF511 family protein [Megaselia abdita]
MSFRLPKTEDELQNLLKTIDSGYKEPSDNLFQLCNSYLPKFKRQGVLTPLEDENRNIQRKNAISCNVPSCKQDFPTVSAYQSHYNSQHRYFCNECKKNLPTPHLLDLHISETHDSFFAVQSERKPMFQCYLEECKEVFWNSVERKDHCISCHRFPKDFRFDQINFQNKKVSNKEMEVDQETVTSKKNSSFSFGHNISRGFTFKDMSYAKALTKNSSKVKNKEILGDSSVVQDLMDSLPKMEE